MWLQAAVALAGETRVARLSEIDGSVEVKVHPADPWSAGLRNQPLVEGSRVATGAGARAEIELDDGSVVRLAGGAEAEIADYLRLSTGQRITHIALDRGVVYFSGEPGGRDAVVVSAGRVQLALKRGSRLRLEAAIDSTQAAVIEGEARWIAPDIEVDVREGRMARLGAGDRIHFSPEVTPLDSDEWSRERDRRLASGASRDRVPNLHQGARELDSEGAWIETQEYGVVWKPRAGDGWTPFREGRWIWYDGWGYTWVSPEKWGWAPYHFGRWMKHDAAGWVWMPPGRLVFQPGDVYWMRGAAVAAWGPLAPGEDWRAAATPSLYAIANTTFARLEEGARTIDPAGFTARPKDPLTALRFVAALPSPSLVKERLEWTRPDPRPGTIRLAPAGPPAPPLPQAPPTPPESRAPA
ncbi:MAG: DUF6600 domain-containing protein, partial [Bryobacteraceae bacterium]